MLTQDYKAILDKSKFVEPKMVDHAWKIMDVLGYPSGTIEWKLFITPGAHIIDRYIEACYVDGVEVFTLQVSGRMIDVVPVGYREINLTNKKPNQ